jgi:TRAP-type C4-dicarboxylate transport system permease small subunit
MDKAEKVIAFIGPLVERLFGIVTMLLPLAIFVASCYYGWKWALQFYIESQANEWLIIIRNGEMVKKGIGLCTWKMPNDQHVKFPSLINQVNFNA